ncbi:MAG TPA: arginine decarboxylase, pyruvoyl-dependent [Flexistipes sinusarabici]|uniref:Pyruvoyl-dependent arginine decarboxylase AaxB n=1 Tax=Flexistipes sinusarabici TaxID=2352 RepID=A0A3D5QD72_FLESI|nr:arginine decarboxylase, pyruvoyl-dependent [Flexistipes sinusarabici]
MIFKTPTKHFFVSGTSEGYTMLNAFDGALLDAGIGNTNLVKMSSIVPPHCKLVDHIKLPQGSLVPVAYASICQAEPGVTLSAAVAAAYPEDESQAGLIMEYSAPARKDIVEKHVRAMAEKGLERRNLKIKEIRSIAVQTIVESIGAAFAAVVLWD